MTSSQTPGTQTPETRAPHTIHRADYRPPEWLVPEVDLDLHLDLDATEVRATLALRRNPANPSRQLRLNGDGLTPLSLTLDGRAYDAWRMAWRMEGPDLLLDLDGEAHHLTITTRLHPAANSQLMGLYASGGMLCTQCEAEGFRRITFFPDRPDVLSTYRVRLSGDKARFPVLLSNGNLVGHGDHPDGSHWAEWHDPWPKPCYLFAAVAGDLVATRARFTTQSGREVTLAIWVRPGDEARTHHALTALTHAMAWDEAVFGREYDLDSFNIVAVADFNMGAMENKGLNIFNTRYVLADPDTATDADYDAIESVIGHEYFHNWSGNRVTCRDWFQLSLKEGFTVLRDQLFSADMGSAAVKRIEDVRLLRSVQFPEDSGPLAHPIRPESYEEISNFYTATVYNKGAEVIRMLRTLAGPARFRAGTDLYFARHDGMAATCEDFIRAIEDGAGLDLTRFRRWYHQAGTPRVTARLSHAGDTATLHLAQNHSQPDTPPLPIPLRLALFDRDRGTREEEQLIVLDTATATHTFQGFAHPPVLSINRGFSAPVILEDNASANDLVFLAAHDDDPFARHEALQRLISRQLIAATEGQAGHDTSNETMGREAIATALRAAITAPAEARLDDLMLGELLILPPYAQLAETIAVLDPWALLDAREGLKAWLGRALAPELGALYDRAAAGDSHDLSPAARGTRKIKTQALVLLAAGDPVAGAARAAHQYANAATMTDRHGALMVLCGLATPEREQALADFHDRFAGDALVIDKWFALQAGAFHPEVLAHAKALARHPDFTLANPNRVRALYMALAMNPRGFHDPSGEGYRIIADLIIALDPTNAQTAARFVAPLGRWRRIEAERSWRMRAELERIAATPGLSRDTAELATKSLG